MAEVKFCKICLYLVFVVVFAHGFAEAARTDAAAATTNRTSDASKASVNAVLAGRWRTRARRTADEAAEASDDDDLLHETAVNGTTGDVVHAQPPASNVSFRSQQASPDEAAAAYDDLWMMESNSSYRREDADDAVSTMAESGACVEKLCECVMVEGMRTPATCRCADPAHVTCWYSGRQCFCKLDKDTVCLAASHKPAACSAATPSRAAVVCKVKPKTRVPGIEYVQCLPAGDDAEPCEVMRCKRTILRAPNKPTKNTTDSPDAGEGGGAAQPVNCDALAWLSVTLAFNAARLLLVEN